MKILLDEDLPRKLAADLSGHDVATVAEMHWKGIKNGVLLDLAVSAGFDVFLTADRGIPIGKTYPRLASRWLSLQCAGTR